MPDQERPPDKQARRCRGRVAWTLRRGPPCEKTAALDERWEMKPPRPTETKRRERLKTMTTQGRNPWKNPQERVTKARPDGEA